MNSIGISRFFGFIVFTGFLGGLACVQVAAEEYEGSLILYDQPENGLYTKIVCTIPFVSGTINFHDSPDCENDKAYGFKLEKVPSATFFGFYDDPDCSGSGNFAFRFKTVKHPTTMETPMGIEEAGKKEVGSVVTPGVMLISTSDRGQVGGKLSCVKIERSAVPSP